MTIPSQKSEKILVTGGAGFIGSNFVLGWLAETVGAVINVDKLTYAGSCGNLADCWEDPRHVFVKADVCDQERMQGLLQAHQPAAIVHFAAESHVDRSIRAPRDFVTTNVIGTFSLLEAARGYWETLRGESRERFRFLQVSTDEVYGSLLCDDPAFHEESRYMPNSPYSATKAAADHLVRAYHHTYGLPTLTTNCSNNYGPRQFPEKLIPLVIHNCIQGKPLPIYGRGANVRDWLFVEDHCEAIRLVMAKGQVGATYNIGGCNEMTNLQVVQSVCAVLDTLLPAKHSYSDLINFVPDRPGHDHRYAIDCTKIRQELDWQPKETFETGISKTIRWYLDHPEWVEQVTSGKYQHWVALHYSQRV